MSDTNNVNSNNRLHDKRVELARRNYELQRQNMNRMLESRYKRDQKAAELQIQKIEKEDKKTEERRQKADERLATSRERYEKKYVGDDKEKKKKFEERTQKTDEFIAKQRERRDEKVGAQRKKKISKREIASNLYKRYIKKNAIRLRNRLRRIENDKGNLLTRKRLIVGGVALVAIILLVVALEFILPGTKLKREEIIDDTPIDEIFTFVPSKEYRVYENPNEYQLIWDLLMEHFDDNETATLGVMCNIMAESEFRAENLENYNNQIWEIDDFEYTEKINRRTINKKDFLEARNYDMTNGYYNEYEQWVNTDGGYGYGQYTSYEKKEDLYQFAEVWFGPGGPGENYKFDIGDPDMQAHYLIYILESDEYATMDARLRTAQNVVDACYLWLKTYEIPYDPYNDNYYTLSFDRAASADAIREACTSESILPGIDDANAAETSEDTEEADTESEEEVEADE